MSDPQERAWYDSHRDAILRDADFGSDEHFEHNIRLTSATDLISLIGKFTANIPFTDNPNGFYGSLRSTFETLAKEENAACDWEGLEPNEYPDFGTAQDSYELVVKPFYAAWAGFATKKTFSWKDTHNFADAPDRRIRRLMEKDNKRLREEGIKEFNDAVRSLVGFVRKRDPRYTPNKQSEADRQRVLRDAAAAQAARSRAIQKAKLDEHVQPAWAQSCQAEEEEGAFSESEQSEEEVVECVTCNKIFKSENQYEAHEKSKKHIKAVQQLMRQMRKENKLFNLDVQLPDIAAPLQPNPIDADSEVPFDSSTDIEINHAAKNAQIESEITSNTLFTVAEPDQKDGISKAGYDEVLSDLAPVEGFQEYINNEYAPRKQDEDRISGLSNPDQQASEMDCPIRTGSIDNVTVVLDAISISSDGDIDGPPREANKKLGKAKAKRAKKAARQQIDTDDQNVRTNFHSISKVNIVLSSPVLLVTNPSALRRSYSFTSTKRITRNHRS